MVFQSSISSWEQHLLSLAKDALCISQDNRRSKPKSTNGQVLKDAFMACEAITSEHSRSFYLASSLLPSNKRSAMRALYAFCRTADNLADRNIDQPKARLSELRANISGHNSTPGDPVLTAWADIHTRFQIPLCYAEQLLDGVERDLIQHRYNTFEELSIYCYGVASTVGLMSMYITGFSDDRAIPYAIKLGVALQLTNILRDVGEDWTSGRLYLPLDELAMFDLDEHDIAAAQVDERWRNFMHFQITRARRLYSEAIPGIKLLHPDGRFAVAAAAFLYQAILDNIEANDFSVFERRAYVGRGRKILLLLRSFAYANNLRFKKEYPFRRI